MPAGLKQAWGLSDAKKGPSDAQAKAFRASFQAAIAPITSALGWTATNAEQEKHDPQSSARDKAYELYQSVLSRIDPSDPSKAAGAIADVLSKVGSLGSGVSGFKKAVETAKAAWEAVADVLSEVVRKIGELEEWGMDGVGDLLSLVKKIQDAVAKRAWEVAKETLEELREKLQPLYEEYEKQKEAKEKYDKERPSLEDGFKAIKKAAGELPGKVGELIGEITKSFDDAGKKAEDKDFVGGIGGLGGIGPALERLQKQMEEERKKKQGEYEKRHGALAKSLAELDKPVDPEALKSLQTPIQKHRSDMEAAAKAEDYDKALLLMDALEPELASYVEFAAEINALKEKFEAREKELQPGITEAKGHVTNPGLEEKQKTILKGVAAMAKAKGEFDYVAGLAEAAALATDLAAYKQALKDHNDEKVEYDNRYKSFEPRWKEAAAPIKNEKLKELQGKVKESRVEVEGLAKAGDYDNALKRLDGADTRLTQYLEYVEEWRKRLKECQDRLKALKAPLAKAAKGAPDVATVKALQGQIVKKEGEARTAVNNEDLKVAGPALDWLEPAVKSYEELLLALEKAKENYEKKAPPIEQRKKEALGYAKPLKFAQAATLKTSIEGNSHTRDAATQKFEEALGRLFTLDADLKAYEGLIAKVTQLEAEYTTRYGSSKGGLDEVAKTHSLNPELLAQQTMINDERAKMEKAAADGDYETALHSLNYLDATVKAFMVKKKDVEDEKAEYETRIKGLAKKLTDAAESVPGEKITDQQAKVTSAKAAAQTPYDAGDYDTALAKLDDLETELAKCLQLIAAQKARIKEYDAKFPAAEQRVNGAAKKVEDPSALQVQQEVLGTFGRIKTAAGNGEYAVALVGFPTLDAQLAAFDAIMARLGGQGGHGAQTPPGKQKQETAPSPPSGSGGGASNQQQTQTTGTNPFDQPANPFG